MQAVRQPGASARLFHASVTPHYMGRIGQRVAGIRYQR
jgi:hypothetical protein